MMDGTEQTQATTDRIRLAAPEVASVLDRHRDEIVDCWDRLGSEKLGVPNLDPAGKKARGLLVLEAMVLALRTGSCAELEKFVRKWAFLFSVHEVDIASHILTWVEGRVAILDVLTRAYPDVADLILECITHVDPYLNHCAALHSKLYAAEIQRQLLLRHERTQWLLDTARAASSSLDLDEVLAHTARTIGKALGLSNCVVIAVDEARKQVLFRRAGSVGISRDALDTGQIALHCDVRFDELSDFSLQLLNHKKPMVFAGVEHDPRYCGYQGFFVGAKSALGLPLIVNSRVVALAWVRAYDSNHIFSTEDIDLAQGIADVAAMGIENARLYGEAARLARTEERQRMARELHDTVAQMSFTIGLRAHQALEDSMLDETSRSHLSAIEHLAARSNLELRSAIFALEHQATGPESELSALLRRLVDEFQCGTGIQVTLILPSELPTLPSMMSTHIFRVVRESLYNVRKHAQASVALVCLRCDEGSVIVSIQDNGVGLPAQPALEHLEDGLHFGLAAMRDIAHQTEGEFTITNNDDGGTLVQVRLPLTREQDR